MYTVFGPGKGGKDDILVDLNGGNGTTSPHSKCENPK